jgi:hypothetical protein
MRSDVFEYCQTCDICQKIFNRYGLLIPNPIPCKPYESVSLDLVVGLLMSNGFNAVLVVVDRLVKHAQLIPTTTGLMAEGFGRLFVKNVACRFGLPDNIVTDRDPCWTSDFWRSVAAHLKTHMWLSSSHHPQHDGQTEIVNKRMEIMLRAYAAEDKTSWSEWLHLLEFAYNSTPSASTGDVPYMLLYGFVPKNPLDFLLPNQLARSSIRTMDPQAESFLRLLQVHRQSARISIAKAQDKQASSHNLGCREIDFQAGDLVMINPHSLEWIESKGKHAKLVQRAIGPFPVQERINSKVYRLDLSDKYPGTNIFNVEHLRRYRQSPDKFGERSILPETRAHKPASEEYQVEKVIGHRRDRKGHPQYLVRWEGYSPLYDSWVTTRDLRNAPVKLREYRDREGF